MFKENKKSLEQQGSKSLDDFIQQEVRSSTGYKDIEEILKMAITPDERKPVLFKQLYKILQEAGFENIFEELDKISFDAYEIDDPKEYIKKLNALYEFSNKSLIHAELAMKKIKDYEDNRRHEESMGEDI